MTVVLRSALSEEPISLIEHEQLVAHRTAGAVVGFAGVVRDHDGGRQVVRLEYSAHPSAEQTLAEVLAVVGGQAVGLGTKPLFNAQSQFALLRSGQRLTVALVHDARAVRAAQDQQHGQRADDLRPVAQRARDHSV